jgi:hypothetical protein
MRDPATNDAFDGDGPPKPEFVSECDLATFEGWLRFQRFDATAATPDELELWHRLFDEGQKRATLKVGLMKLRPLIEGERRYAVAIRDGSDLWLTLWVQCSPKPEYFVLIPRADRSWDAHTSYHRDGTLHMKSFGGRPVLKQQRRPLTGPFEGTEHLGTYSGHGGKSIGAVCDPTAFSGVVEATAGVLGPVNGSVAVDLVEPGCEPLWCPGETVQQEVFKDATPWVVIRIFRS